MIDLKNYIMEGLDKGYSKKEITSVLLDKGYSEKEIDFAFSNRTEKSPSNKIKVPTQSDLSYMDRFKLLFSNPEELFSRIKESGIGNALGLAFICAVISIFLLTMVIFMFVGVLYKSGGYAGAGMFYSILSAFLYLIIFGIGLFVYSGVTHLVIKLMGGTGCYSDSFNACTYGIIPFIILAVIPFIGWLSIIYSIIVMSMGLSKYHDLPKGRCALAACIPIIVLILAVVFFIFLLISAF
ncbi:hypothetical protein COU54_02690 [Candidatus Pacearchaeota archaeon CG10_big_fil_rev_8_21_14_0_10_31_24]|nr:MAG: hypothetical protein COU54_02690 [Candidatus Pacearchaeota archaeon CG10_big_fil_rev_8_21_14_0_10_31_24]